MAGQSGSNAILGRTVKILHTVASWLVEAAWAFAGHHNAICFDQDHTPLTAAFQAAWRVAPSTRALELQSRAAWD